MDQMKRVLDARKRNLRELIERNNDEHGRGGITVVAKRMGLDWSGFVSHLLHGRRQMGEATARQIETAFSLPHGSMDSYPLHPHGQSAPVNDNRPLVVLADAANRAGVKLPPEKLEAALRLMESAGRADAEYADTVVSLMK